METRLARGSAYVADLQGQIAALEGKLAAVAEEHQEEMCDAVAYYAQKSTAALTKKIIKLEEKILSVDDVDRIHRGIKKFVDAVAPTREVEDSEDDGE